MMNSTKLTEQELDIDIIRRARDLAWAHARKLEWQVETLERELQESISRYEEYKLMIKDQKKCQCTEK